MIRVTVWYALPRHPELLAISPRLSHVPPSTESLRLGTLLTFLEAHALDLPWSRYPFTSSPLPWR